MRTTFRVLAHLIAIGVVVQAAAVAYVMSGLFTWIVKGGVLDAATLESDALDFPEVIGFIVHGMNGMIVLPALAVLLLVVSFFAKVPRGTLWSGLLVALIAAQVLLGVAHMPATALLHGINALVVFALAILAGRAARPTRAPAATTAPADTTLVR